MNKVVSNWVFVNSIRGVLNMKFYVMILRFSYGKYLLSSELNVEEFENIFIV